MLPIAGLKLTERLQKYPKAHAVLPRGRGEDVEIRDTEMPELVEHQIDGALIGGVLPEQTAEEIGVEEIEQELIIDHVLLAHHDIERCFVAA